MLQILFYTILSLNLITTIVLICVRIFKENNNFNKITRRFVWYLFLLFNFFIFTLGPAFNASELKSEINNYDNLKEVEVIKSDEQFKIISPTQYYFYKIDFSYFKQAELRQVLDYEESNEFIFKAYIKDNTINVIKVYDKENLEVYNSPIIDSSNQISIKMNSLNVYYKVSLGSAIFFGVMLGLLVLHTILVFTNYSKDFFELKEYFYVFPFSLFNWSNLFVFVITLTKFLKKLVEVNKNIFDIELVLLIITSLNIVVKVVGDVRNYSKNSNHFVDRDLEKDIFKDIKLSKEDKDNGYKCYPYVNLKDEEYYLMSEQINHHIYNNELKFNYNKKNTFVLPSIIKTVMPYALKQKLTSKDKLFNETIMRMSNDLYLDTKEIALSKTSYFDALSTNHIINKELLNKVNERNKFYGHSYVKNDKGELIKLEESSLANHIGINTIAITKDDYVVINQQGDKSNVGKNKLVNTGSGSLTYSDFRKCKNESFNDVLVYGVERELLEETGFKVNKDNRAKVTTKMFGYMRVLKFGGKPDFFGISIMDVEKKDIEKQIKTSKEHKSGLMGDPLFLNIDKNNIEQSIVDQIDLLEQEGKPITVQLHISREIIKSFIAKDIKLFDELKKNK